MREATFKQRMALYKFTKVNNKNVLLSFNTANSLLSKAFDGEDITEQMQAIVDNAPARDTVSTKSTKTKVNFQSVYDEACNAGLAAAEKEPESFPCGFATAYVTPARGAFVSWCKKNDKGFHSKYPTGWHFVNEGLFTQSMDRNRAYANAFAKVIRDRLDVDCRVDSRID